MGRVDRSASYFHPNHGYAVVFPPDVCMEQGSGVTAGVGGYRRCGLFYPRQWHQFHSSHRPRDGASIPTSVGGAHGGIKYAVHPSRFIPESATGY